jgi:hypothetical protein
MNLVEKSSCSRKNPSFPYLHERSGARFNQPGYSLARIPSGKTRKAIQSRRKTKEDYRTFPIRNTALQHNYLDCHRPSLNSFTRLTAAASNRFRTNAFA